jgi:hypothetical protein
MANNSINNVIASSSKDGNRYLLGIAVVAFVVGVIIRFSKLSEAPLAVDEYYLGMSILNTLERGLPEFLCGGFYTRGLLLQYLSVPLLESGVQLELAVRLWPAVASVFTIFAAWKIAELVGGRNIAAISVILLSLSLWEIEFARFGRMYAPFQAVFLWYLYFQMLHLLRGRESARWAYMGLSAIAIFVYAGAAFLLALNFLGLIWKGKQWSIAHLVISFVLLLIGLSFYSTDFRYADAPVDQVLADVASEPVGNLPINVPWLPETLLPIGLIGVLIACAVFWLYRRQIFVAHGATLYWILAALLLSFGLWSFGVALIVVAVLFEIPPFRTARAINPNKLIWQLLVLAIVWVVIVAASFQSDGESLLTIIKGSLNFVFNYPDVYYTVVRPWFRTIPGTTLVSAGLITALFWTAIFQKSSGSERFEGIRYLFGVAIILLLLTALLYQPYRITRYTYFLYPIVLVLSAAGIMEIARRFGSLKNGIVVGTFCLGLYFAFSEDFRIRHLLNINDSDYRFRTAYNDRLASHYYPRWDFRGAADFVNARLQPADSVIVFDQPLTWYLDRTTAVFVREGSIVHSLVAACGGERHLWSNYPLVDREPEVEDVITRTEGTVWLVSHSSLVPWRDEIEQSLVDIYNLEEVFTTVDERLVVYAINRGSETR